MATLTSTACQTSASGFFLNPPRYIENGVVARSAQYTFTAAQSAGDVIQMIPIPKGAMVIDVAANSVVGGAAFAYFVGDGNSTQRYINSASASGTSLLVRMNQGLGLGYSYSADDTIDIGIQTVASASAAGTIRLTVMYSFDNSTDGNS